MKHELPQTVRVARFIDEAEGIRSVLFAARLQARPGQFVMIWLPGVDSKPVGVSYQDDQYFGVTVSAVGAWSQGVFEKPVGGYLGILGPYGNGFTLTGRRIVLVGGGYGSASLMLLAEEAQRRGVKATLIIGARTASKLLYRQRCREQKLDAIFTTDDGSFGVRGTNTDTLAEILEREKIDQVYACGPELMEKRIAELCVARKVPAQISLERHMKCGFGVCGACSVDPDGQRICVEGPVFSAEEALAITEFGRFHRDSSAAKHYF